MAVSKIKMSNARRALIEAGMSRTMARGALRLLDLSEPLKPQIVALAEEDPELFGLDADGNPLPDDDDAEDERPMTVREATNARLRGTAHLKGTTFRRPAQPRPSTASKAAQEAAAHLTSNHRETPPPVRKYIEPVRDLNAGAKQFNRERPSSADALANRLRGN
ncbi:hypothetical protein [Streptomyces sp. NPDC059452]|uniref:hypothetical protein n=1 Tax=Streptomyces sp. NPDC059452 TaxID=3346835 RepID=UPI0036ADCD89